MFHFLDDDTDMYNTPYTYNAGRLVSLLAMNTLCLAVHGRTSHFFFNHSECTISVSTVGKMLFFFPLSFLSMCNKKRGSFLMQMRTNTILSPSSPLLVYSLCFRNV